MNIRQRRALETKKKITEKAMELINEKGFQNVTVDEIVKKTSTSKGAFYNHFRSKHDIFLEKFKEIDNYYVDEIVPKLENADHSISKLKFFLDRQMTYIEHDIGWDVVRTIYEHELNTERESSFLIPDRPLYQILFNLCEEGQKREELRDDFEPKQMVATIVRVMRGILYDWSINKGKYPLRKEAKSLFEVLLRGLLK